MIERKIKMYMYKSGYNEFMKNVNILMEEHKGIKDQYNNYTLNTFCGKLRIHIEEFKSKQKVQWIMTQIENPDKVLDCYKLMPNFNRHNGKMMVYSDDYHFLYNWLWQYITTVTSKLNYSDENMVIGE